MSTAKIDRHKKRSPAAARYRNENRRATNKKRKIAKHMKMVEKHAHRT